MGNGFFSRKLSYKDWFNFNLAVRVHANFLEQITLVCFVILVAGIKYPLYTIYATIAYSTGRQLYILGYTRSVKGRILGVVVFNIALNSLFVMAIMSAWQLRSQ